MTPLQVHRGRGRGLVAMAQQLLFGQDRNPPLRSTEVAQLLLQGRHLGEPQAGAPSTRGQSLSLSPAT